MTTEAFESILAVLYTDAEMRRAFLTDPAVFLEQFALSPEERLHLMAIDRVGLEIAAKTFSWKRSRNQRSSL